MPLLLDDLYQLAYFEIYMKFINLIGVLYLYLALEPYVSDRLFYYHITVSQLFREKLFHDLPNFIYIYTIIRVSTLRIGSIAHIAREF